MLHTVTPTELSRFLAPVPISEYAPLLEYRRTEVNCNIYYTKILEVNLFEFAYRLFHKGFSPIDGAHRALPRRLERNLHETVCRQMQTN